MEREGEWGRGERTTEKGEKARKRSGGREERRQGGGGLSSPPAPLSRRRHTGPGYLARAIDSGSGTASYGSLRMILLAAAPAGPGYLAAARHR